MGVSSASGVLEHFCFHSSLPFVSQPAHCLNLRERPGSAVRGDHSAAADLCLSRARLVVVAARVLETLPVGCDTCVPTAVLIGSEFLAGRAGGDCGCVGAGLECLWLCLGGGR